MKFKKNITLHDKYICIEKRLVENSRGSYDMKGQLFKIIKLLIGMSIYHILMAILVGQMLKIALNFLNTCSITKKK